MTAAAPLLPVLLLLAAGAHTAAGVPKLVMVWAQTRHGARHVLPKSVHLSESAISTGPTLLPQGQRMCYDAGAAFRARYIDRATCGDLCLTDERGQDYGPFAQPGVGFSLYDMLVRSSGLDRTLSSAQAFLAGAFPPLQRNGSSGLHLPTGEQVIPVYSSDEANDHLLRAYTRCPAYNDRLLNWFAGEEFAAMEEETRAFRTELKALAPVVNTSLAGFWNVYDAWSVWRQYQVGTPLPQLTDTQYAELESIAFWLETAKMQHNLTGDGLIGGPLAGDLLQYMEQAVEATGGSIQELPLYHKLLLLSGHYNGLLGLLAALGVSQGSGGIDADSVPWLTSIPNLASVLGFELYADRVAPHRVLHYVRAVFQDGPQEEYQPIPLPCASDEAEDLAGEGACTWMAFRELAGRTALRSVGDWCDACRQRATISCLAHYSQQQLAAQGCPSSSRP